MSFSTEQILEDFKINFYMPIISPNDEITDRWLYVCRYIINLLDVYRYISGSIADEIVTNGLILANYYIEELNKRIDDEKRSEIDIEILRDIV